MNIRAYLGPSLGGIGLALVAVAAPAATPWWHTQNIARPLLASPEEVGDPDDFMSLAVRRSEMGDKLGRLGSLMSELGLDALLITAVHNFQWLTAGGDSHIVLASREGVATLVICSDGRRYAVTSTSEAARLMDEDLRDLGFELRTFRWFEDKSEPNRRVQVIEELAGEGLVGSDLPFPGAVDIENDLREQRYELTDNEVEKYRWIGRRAAEAVDEVARNIEPGMSEREIEAMTSDALMRRGLTPTVLLIGVDDRLLYYRHATPTDQQLERYAMINICARRWGLVIATSRFVHFGPVPDDLQAKFEAAATVEAAFLSATSPGASADHVLDVGRQAYASVGYGDEWLEHHQGGAIGYLEREWVAFPGSTERVHSSQAFAWNPTIQGTKVEDTVLVMGNHNEILTYFDGWPTVRVTWGGQEYDRPGVLVR